MTISTQKQVEELRNTLIKNAELSYTALQKCMSSMTAMQFFSTIKFDKIGIDPIGSESQNLIEQVNQMYSNLVVLAAAEDILGQYPNASLELQLGSSSGYDIESTDGLVAAECFSVTAVSNNRKLYKDCAKLMKSAAAIKCVYFYSHQDNEKKLQKIFQKYPEISFKRIYFDIL